MKTSDLIGPALDWAVELALGTHWSPNGYFCHSITEFNRNPKHAYSIDWAQGGQIIEREGIFPTLTDLERNDDGSVSFTRVFRAKTPAQYLEQDEGVYGPTPLVAAMRCLVASKLGDDVEIPQELL